MNVQINWVAVLLATVAPFVVGMIWFSDALFGRAWAELTGMTEKKMKAGMGKAITYSIIPAFLTAYVLAHLTYLAHSFFNNSFMSDALQTAFWVWVGITASLTVRQDAFEQQPMKLTAIRIGSQLAGIMSMAVIIGWLHP